MKSLLIIAIIVAVTTILLGTHRNPFSRALFLGKYRNNTLSITANDTALILLDPLETYRNTFTQSQISQMVQIVETAQRMRVPVIVTRWVRTRGALGDVYDEIGHWSQYVPTPEEPLLKELDHIKWDLWLDTIYTDAFAPVYQSGRRNENVLREFLKRRNVQNLVIAGTWAEACVAQTAYAASVYGMTPIVLQPAVGGYFRLSLVMLDQIRAHVVNAVHFVETEIRDPANFWGR